MKTTLALATLSSKFIMLLCMSCMSFFGMTQDSFAQQTNHPCHQEIAQESKKHPLCYMCETTLENGEEGALVISNEILTKVTEFDLPADTAIKRIVFKLKPLEGVYQAYYPPPIVLLKAVTPNTENIVSLS